MASRWGRLTVRSKRGQQRFFPIWEIRIPAGLLPRQVPQALTFFEDETELFKKLHAAYPENVDFKNGLAISYSKLGWLYRYKMNESEKAKPYFQKCYDIWKEMSEQFPDYQEFRNNYEWAKEQLGQ